jgi:hypothetical protein
MPTLTIALADLPQELRDLAARDQRALNAANLRTVSVDAQRWIQWSIRGGGLPPMFGPPPPPKATNRRKKQKGRGLLKKVLGRIKKALKMKGVPRVKKTIPKGAKEPAKPKQKERPAPAGYRIPIDTGDYANSWRWEVTDEGGMVYASPNPPIKAGVIELGRRPGKGIPLDPLADWVRRKLGVRDPKKARGIAFAISVHQKRNGRKGLRVLERARPKIIEAAGKNIERELRRFANSRTRPPG